MTDNAYQSRKRKLISVVYTTQDLNSVFRESHNKTMKLTEKEKRRILMARLGSIGGKKTAKKYGKKYMSEIGKRGRLKQLTSKQV